MEKDRFYVQINMELIDKDKTKKNIDHLFKAMFDLPNELLVNIHTAYDNDPFILVVTIVGFKENIKKYTKKLKTYFHFRYGRYRNLTDL